MNSKFFENIYKSTFRNLLNEARTYNREDPLVQALLSIIGDNIKVPVDAEIYPYFKDANGTIINSLSKKWITLSDVVNDLYKDRDGDQQLEDIPLNNNGKLEKIHYPKGNNVKFTAKNILMGICGIDFGIYNNPRDTGNSFRQSAYNIHTWDIENPDALPAEWKELYDKFSENSTDEDKYTNDEKLLIVKGTSKIIKLEKSILSKDQKDELLKTLDQMDFYLKNITNTTTINNKLIDFINKSLDDINNALLIVKENEDSIETELELNLIDELENKLNDYKYKLETGLKNVKDENERRKQRAKEQRDKMIVDREAAQAEANKVFSENINILIKKAQEFNPCYITSKNIEFMKKLVSNANYYSHGTRAISKLFKENEVDKDIGVPVYWDNDDKRVHVAVPAKDSFLWNQLFINAKLPRRDFENVIEYLRQVRTLFNVKNEDGQYIVNLILRGHNSRDILNFIVNKVKNRKSIQSYDNRYSPKFIFNKWESIYNAANNDRLRETLKDTI